MTRKRNNQNMSNMKGQNTNKEWQAKLKWQNMSITIRGFENTITYAHFGNINSKKTPLRKLTKSENTQILKWFEKGNPTPGKFKISLNGTKFQMRVWKELQKIARGKTISYQELAKRIGNKNATRAAANACGKNPLPLFIPCHRVIRTDGSLGGFSSGISIKKKLLKIEGSY